MKALKVQRSMRLENTTCELIYHFFFTTVYQFTLSCMIAFSNPSFLPSKMSKFLDFNSFNSILWKKKKIHIRYFKYAVYLFIYFFNSPFFLLVYSFLSYLHKPFFMCDSYPSQQMVLCITFFMILYNKNMLQLNCTGNYFVRQ